MKKLIISLLTILLFYACGTMKHKENEYTVEVKRDDLVDLLEGIDFDKMSASIKRGLSTRQYGFSAGSNQGEYKYWQNGDWQSVPMATIEKQLYQHNGRIYDKDSGRIASYCNIGLDFGDSIYYLARLNEFGMLETFQIGWKKYGGAIIYANCDSLGNIANIQDYVAGRGQTKEFKNGKGWWYDYYILPPADGESIMDLGTFLEINFTTKIKSKGRLKNNFKVGRWKYYDPEGRLIRTERFRLRDSIDIRFPYSMIPKK